MHFKLFTNADRNLLKQHKQLLFIKKTAFNDEVNHIFTFLSKKYLFFMHQIIVSFAFLPVNILVLSKEDQSQRRNIHSSRKAFASNLFRCWHTEYSYQYRPLRINIFYQYIYWSNKQKSNVYDNLSFIIKDNTFTILHSHRRIFSW